MRVINIQFRGYKRLADTNCNTDGRMIAFLGPNEAGKSSVLQALEWFSSGSPLPPVSENRTNPPGAGDEVVRVTYAIEEADSALWSDLQVVGDPNRVVLARTKDGTFRTGLFPELRRDPKLFDAARDALADFEAQWEPEIHTRMEGGDPENMTPDHTLREWMDALRDIFGDANRKWDLGWDETVGKIRAWLREAPDDDEIAGLISPGEQPVDARGLRLAEALDNVEGILRSEHPNDTARNRAGDKAPHFAMFTPENRELQSAYDLADPNVRSAPPAALANLVWIADLDLEALWAAMQADNITVVRTAKKRANEALTKRLGKTWSQADISVTLEVDGTRLLVLIDENDDHGSQTTIGERSDGLRMFIALVAFLARQNFDVPPILLVDEAETHLHYDAQADLIEVLANDVEATQVFYTTHSPGCLPRDLGTGVRLVAPDKKQRDASKLRNDFWTNQQPGFTPLLFAMGAGAAAFSAFRKAVLTEGAADMILLPSLLRLATGERDLAYQIAPGLSGYNGDGFELETTAVRVAYLLDGDRGGQEHRDRLLDMGIDDARIFNLETNRAAEDYVHPDRYLEVVNTFLTEKHHPTVSLDALQRGIPIAKAVQDWCKAQGFDPPGKTIVASRLIGEPDKLRLADNAAEVLAQTHKRINDALDA